jgi:hypothetical protein
MALDRLMIPTEQHGLEREFSSKGGEPGRNLADVALEKLVSLAKGAAKWILSRSRRGKKVIKWVREIGSQRAQARAETAGRQAATTAELAEVKRGWIRQLRKRIKLGASEPIASYRTIARRRSFALYRLKEAPSSGIIVVFPTLQGTPTMPWADFLQGAQVLGLDVAVVRASTKDGRTYSGSFLPFAQGFESLLEGLERELHEYDLSNAQLVGTSAGAVPAVVAGLVLGVERVVAVGVVEPQRYRWLGPLEVMLEQGFHDSSLPETTTKFRSVYGDEAPGEDKRVSEKLANLLSGEAEGIRGAGHTPLGLLLERGEIPEWFLHNFSAETR